MCIFDELGLSSTSLEYKPSEELQMMSGALDGAPPPPHAWGSGVLPAQRDAAVRARRKRGRRPRSEDSYYRSYPPPAQPPPFSPPRPPSPLLDSSPFSLGWDQMPAAFGRELRKLFMVGGGATGDDAPPLERRQRGRHSSDHRRTRISTHV